MILVGQYSSPFVRRVAVTLRILGHPYEHDTRSVFRDFDSMRQTNPVGRIPSLVLDDGEVLIDSVAILDWLDELAGPTRALIPRAGSERRRCLRLIALATGAIDKTVTSAYERIIRPEQLAVAGMDWPMPQASRERHCCLGDRTMACDRRARPGANYDGLHVSVRAAGRSRSPAVRSLPESGCIVAAMREPDRVSGHLSP